MADIPISVRAAVGEKARSLMLPEGMSVAEMFAASGIAERRRPYTVARVAGYDIPPEWWGRTKPRAVEGQLVEFAVVPQGTGSVSKGFGFLSQGLLLAGGGPFGSSAFGPLGLFASFIPGTIQAIFGSGPQRSRRRGGPAQAQDRSAGTSLNAIEPFAQHSDVFGTVRVAPRVVATPYVELDGTNQIVSLLLGLPGRKQWANIEVNDVDIDEQSDNIDYETEEGYSGDTAQTTVSKSAKLMAADVELNEFRYLPNSTDYPRIAQGTSATDAEVLAARPKRQPLGRSSSAPNEIWITLFWPNGLYRGAAQVVSMGLRLRLRQSGGSWRNLPELRFRGEDAQPIRYMIKLIFSGSEPSTADPASGERCYKAPIAVTELDAGDSIPGNGDWDADAWFGTENDHVFVFEDHMEIYLDPDDATNPWPADYWEVDILRGCGADGENTSSDAELFDLIFDSTGGAPIVGFFVNEQQDGQVHRCIVESVHSIEDTAPVSEDDLAVLAVAAKNTRIASVTAEISSYAPIWDGADWDTVAVTDNPAALWRLVATGDLNAEPIAESTLTTDSIEDWYDYCDTNSVEVNAEWEGGSVEEALTFLAEMGHARMVRGSAGGWGVVIDQDRSAETPTQVFSARNSRGFSARKAFERRPHALIVTYTDSADKYRTVNRTVYDDGFSASNATRFEAITLAGKVTAAEVDSFALRMLRRRRLRTTQYEIEIGLEAIQATRGELVAVNHDAIDVAHYGSARVREVLTSGGNATGLVLDAALLLGNPEALDVWSIEDIWLEEDIWTATGVGVSIHLKDGTVITHAIDEVIDTDRITFTTPFATPSGLEAGCLVVAGESSSEHKRLLLRELVKASGRTARVVMEDEAQGIFA